MKKILLVLVLSIVASGAIARNKKPDLADEISASVHSHFDRAPDGPLTEVAFSPEAGSEQLVLKVINASQHSIRLAAYSFTSPAVVRGLLDAKKRGVDIQVVVDDKGNRALRRASQL